MKLSEQIRVARETKGLTQYELGNRIGVSRLTISRYENEDKIPKTEELCDLAAHLSKSLTIFDCVVTPLSMQEGESEKICFDASAGAIISSEGLKVSLKKGAVNISTELVLKPRRRA